MIKKNSLALATLSAVFALSLFAPSNEIVTARGYKTLSSVSGNSGADGVALFDSKCALCHGKDGVGLPNWRSLGQPDFTKPEWQNWAHRRTDRRLDKERKREIHACF